MAIRRSLESAVLGILLFALGACDLVSNVPYRQSMLSTSVELPPAQYSALRIAAGRFSAANGLSFAATDSPEAKDGAIMRLSNRSYMIVISNPFSPRVYDIDIYAVDETIPRSELRVRLEALVRQITSEVPGVRADPINERS